MENTNLLRKQDNSADLLYKTIQSDNLDSLVKQAVANILEHGETINVRAGKALQDYGISYTLTNPKDRLHNLRKNAVRYLCRELIAYFNGSLKAEDGLVDASKFWATLVDEDGNINSNYGYYVFYEPVEEYGSQYNWVIQRLLSNPDSRRAIININQNYHKSETKDFPCTVSIQFFIKSNTLYCEVASRSTDVVTGLPYDMGFFSFLHELVFADLKQSGMEELRLGGTTMKTSFTQIYDSTRNKAMEVVEKQDSNISMHMPELKDARAFIEDIYKHTRHTNMMKWIVEHAK